MNLLPVITRELQVQSRLASSNRLRWIAAGVVTIIWCFLMVVGGNASPHDRAQYIFVATGIVSLVYVMMAGVFQTADCISEERREGTLGLLFLTDLHGHDVVLGKLASSSLSSFYTFLATLPVMALPLLMGGMTVGEFWRVMLVLVVTLYLSLAVGMFISTLSRDARGAMSGAFLIMLGLGLLMPLIWILTASRTISIGHEVWMVVSPSRAFQCAFDEYYSVGGTGVRNFWNSIMVMLAMGAGCLVWASALLPRVWQETGEAVRNRPILSRLRADVWTNRRLLAARKMLRDVRPFLWLTTRDGRPRALANVSFAVLVPVWVYLYAKLLILSRRSEPEFMILMLMTFVMHLILKCLVAVEAGRRFSEDRASGALELLLVTPLRPAEIVAAQFRGVWLSFRWCFLALLLANLSLLIWIFNTDMFGTSNEPRTVFSLMLGGGIVALFVDGFALIKVGMWTALIKKRHAQAFMAAVMRVLLPSWLGLVFFFFVEAVGSLGGGRGTVTTAVVVHFLLGMVVAFVAAGSATSHLDQNFREIASLGKVELPLPLPQMTD